MGLRFPLGKRESTPSPSRAPEGGSLLNDIESNKELALTFFYILYHLHLKYTAVRCQF